MISKTIEIQGITVDELADRVADKLLAKIEDYLKKLADPKNEELMTRVEVSRYLRVSTVTISNWSKNGILNPVRIGNRVFFTKKSIIDTLNKRSGR